MDEFMVSTLISAVASGIAANLSDKDLALAASVLTQLGDNLNTIAVLRTRRPSEPIIESETIF